MFHVAISLGNTDAYEDPKHWILMSKIFSPKNRPEMLITYLLMSYCYLIETTRIRNSTLVVSTMFYEAIVLAMLGIPASTTRGNFFITDKVQHPFKS